MRPAPALATMAVALAATAAVAAPATAVPTPAASTGSGTTAGFPTRVLARDAVFYRRLPDATPVAGDSSHLVRSLEEQAEAIYGGPGRPNIDIQTDRYSPTMYVAHDSDPVASWSAVNCQGKWDGWEDDLLGDHLHDVHVPSGAQPDSSDDGLMVVYNPDQDTITETWMTRKTGDNSYSVCWGGTLRHASKSRDGRFVSTYGASASGLTQAAYVIRASELKSGHINHVINMGIPKIAAWPVKSWPASRTDGGTPGDELAEGQMLRLPRSVNVDALHLSPVARTIAHAAQDYGIMITETAGAVTFVAENPKGLGSDPYPGLFRGRFPTQEFLGDPSKGEGQFPLDQLVALPRDYHTPKTPTTVKRAAPAPAARAVAAGGSSS